MSFSTSSDPMSLIIPGLPERFGHEGLPEHREIDFLIDELPVRFLRAVDLHGPR